MGRTIIFVNNEKINQLNYIEKCNVAVEERGKLVAKSGSKCHPDISIGMIKMIDEEIVFSMICKV